MISLFKMIGRFINNMDARAWTSLLVSLSLLGFILIMALYGREWLGLSQVRVQDMMIRISESPFAIVGVISVFALLALTGFPQMLLIAGTVAVFGAQQGGIYSWIATMASATLTFAIGHVFGGSFVKKLSAGRMNKMVGMMRDHGIMTTMIVRWTPSAPFIVINSIAGAARISIVKFWIGTGLGIIPKIVFIAAFTGQVDELMKFFTNRDPQHLVILAVLIVGWLGFLLFVRWLYMRMRRRNAAEAAGATRPGTGTGQNL
ncbi:TVP38/TMEM64 family protein [Parvularcula flava]|uniref:TVP38/TMEM64 family membrane protein n=1 Tax=Aquisalinus luteolus TaxID=1566827 RepID=A0A8J3A1S4_9PROT|nr:VTT domain-containing protein [Aquisalinus luteolus]NHK27837.1 TVP38/TMEM64 family protein [Aquisalinus luteolus]GGH96657.1 TVP38/TMEM64 family protein [Aquisalinus luteolus]